MTPEQTAESLASLAYSAAGRDRATCKPSIALDAGKVAA